MLSAASSCHCDMGMTFWLPQTEAGLLAQVEDDDGLLAMVHH